ncbi:hypothetical protein E3N88_00591 [Mikania micrantha]|uniref:Uncharacterized protein n=1 Tax=Mikania micrantha TaxID=192012 RepID=A0A5N6PYK5_9ASTR|nr:hypothetical protein E3N88_00591 [Mikania micrantha]
MLSFPHELMVTVVGHSSGQELEEDMVDKIEVISWSMCRRRCVYPKVVGRWVVPTILMDILGSWLSFSSLVTFVGTWVPCDGASFLSLVTTEWKGNKGIFSAAKRGENELVEWPGVPYEDLTRDLITWK